MLENREGKRVPEVVFRTRANGDWKNVSTKDLFAGKKVIVFSLPGAFTPTCSSTHLPRYNELTPVFKKHGVDDVICISVNDGFVMEAWAKEEHAENITIIPDGNGEFSLGMGMLVDKADLGFGKRSWRYSMLVDDGVIKKMFIEPQKPGDPFEVSDADTMLQYLAPGAKLPPEVTILSKPGCAFCIGAKKLLQENGYPYEEISLQGGISYKTLRNLTGQATAPQIYINGEHIKGLDGLKAYFAK
ncbi:MAG: glutathione peroxidase [Bdellovibrionales bacterium]|nr:glutathione peroxidase [Bdellovibrionales bacterium]